MFETAAAMLACRTVVDEEAQAFLGRLEYLGGPPELIPHRSALLLVAARFLRIFGLRAPDAPNLVVLGAQVDPQAFGLGPGPVGDVAGTGLSFREAFESCVGEGVEYASQFMSADDPVALLPEDDALAGASPALHELWTRLAGYRRRARHTPTAWVNAADLASGEPVRVPVDLCFRRPPDLRDLDPPWPLSTGTGAGLGPLDAALHGLLELVERDAVALWWRGGRPAHVISNASGNAMLEHLRGGPTHRRAWLLDVTSDVGVPVVVAASCNDDGFGLCCGFAARPTQAKAAEAAVREMAQMELAHHLSEVKRQTQGEACLSELDRRHIERFRSIDVKTTRALHPVAPPRRLQDLPEAEGLVTLRMIRQGLESVGLSPCVLNLTRSEIGVPAVRVLCPGLEIAMTSPPGPRLQVAASDSGFDPTSAAPL
ncbi:MAG: YcaO-like family protein [Reyranella sp.]|nr:YcaO-like family protein [Reyranella sp.]